MMYCPNCENSSGWTRCLGRDNDEIVDECPNHPQPLDVVSNQCHSKRCKKALPHGWKSEYCDDR